VTLGGPNRRPANRLRRTEDGGTTLIEVVVSMSIMSVFMAMFTVGVVQMSRAANKNEATSTAQSQLNIAFMRLDKEIRYAAGVSAPGSVSGDPYVEYLITNSGTPLCTQLRLLVTSGQLQHRTWVQGSSPLTPSAWIPLASQVSATQPFTFFPADSTYNFQRLQLKLVATSGAGPTATAKQTDVTFTAMNTSLSTSSATVCTEGRSVP
jgi:type II secretory pathway pseudopilin PulG